jgi:hypothetical protein
MFRFDGSDVKATDPYFICVERKRQVTEDLSSKAQLLAQIRALQIQRFPIFSQLALINRDNQSRTGALTDGLTWSFWHSYHDGWYFEQFSSGSLDEALHLLSNILLLLI